MVFTVSYGRGNQVGYLSCRFLVVKISFMILTFRFSVCLSDYEFPSQRCFADKMHVAPTIRLVNDLNKLLKSQVFVSAYRQWRAIHLILDFELLSDTIQDIGNAILTSDPRLNRINITMRGFLSQEDVVHTVQQQPLPIVAIPREGTASSQLSLKEELINFDLRKKRKKQKDLLSTFQMKKAN